MPTNRQQLRQRATMAERDYRHCRLIGDHQGARTARAKQIRAALAFNRCRHFWQRRIPYLRMETTA